LSLTPLLIALMSFWQSSAPVSHYSFETCEPIDLMKGNSRGIHQGNPECQCGVADFAPVYDGRVQKTVIEGKVNQYFASTDLTVSLYFKPLGKSKMKQTLISKRISCSPDNAFEIVYHPGNPGNVEVIFSQTAQAAFFNLKTSLEPETDWHHVAVTRQGQWAELYVNGLQRTRVMRCAGVDITNSASLQIAAGPCDFQSLQVPFNGVVDELSVFNYALNAIEMKAWYDKNPVELAETDCLALVPLNTSY
jgi:hypothetical protein